MPTVYSSASQQRREEFPPLASTGRQPGAFATPAGTQQKHCPEHWLIGKPPQGTRTAAANR
jgi:hypothetical protein